MKFGYKNHVLPLNLFFDLDIFHIISIIYEIFTAYFTP